MYTTIQKWGNSNAIRIPKGLLEQLQLSENDKVEITANETSIIIKKPKRKYKSLDELLQGYEGEYKFEEIDWGNPVGEEIW